MLSIIALLFMVAGSIGLDQVSKIHSQTELMVWTDDEDPTKYQGHRYPIFATGDSSRSGEGFYLSFGWNYVRNLGAAWGALSNLPDSIRVPFFYLVTFVAVIIIGIYMRSTPVEHRLARFALSLILSGAVGNFIDRLTHGFVIDFIDVRWRLFGWRYDFPNFNIADCAITVGVSLLMYDMLVLETQRRRLAESEEKPAAA